MHEIPYVWHMKPNYVKRNYLFAENLHEKVTMNLLGLEAENIAGTYKGRVFSIAGRGNNSEKNVDNCK